MYIVCGVNNVVWIVFVGTYFVRCSLSLMKQNVGPQDLLASTITGLSRFKI